MEIPASSDASERRQLFEEHQQNQNAFKTFSKADLSGRETEEGIIHATDDEEIRQILSSSQANFTLFCNFLTEAIELLDAEDETS